MAKGSWREERFLPPSVLCLLLPPHATAPESLALPTLPLTAVSLVFSILAVVLFVTGPSHGDAPPAWAGKVIGWTSGFPPTWFGKKTSVGLVAQPPAARWDPKGSTWLERQCDTHVWGRSPARTPHSLPRCSHQGSCARLSSLRSRLLRRTPSSVHSTGRCVRTSGTWSPSPPA